MRLGRGDGGGNDVSVGFDILVLLRRLFHDVLLK